MPYTDPERRRQYQREYRRVSRAGECTTPCQSRIPAEFRLTTARDALAVFDEQIAAVRAETRVSTMERARTIGFLVGVALRAIESGDQAARLEAVEAVLKLRRNRRHEP